MNRGISLLQCLNPTSTHSNDKPVLARAPSSIDNNSRIEVSMKRFYVSTFKVFYGVISYNFVSRSGRNSSRHLIATSRNTTYIPERMAPMWSHAAVACMADGQPSALGTGRHPGSKTSEGLRGRARTVYMCGADTCDLNDILMS